MKQLSMTVLALIAGITLFTACKKSKSDATSISVKQTQIGSLITGDTLCGTIKGTMVSGKTYIMTCPVTINFGDTVLMQRGVTIDVENPAAYFLVQGVFISLGTKDSANWITVKSITKSDNVSTANSPSSDPAFISSKLWLGFQCDTMCPLVVMKWTHLEFVGGTFSTTPPLKANSAGANAWAMYMTNPNGIFVFEDSWMYGGVDDGMRPNCNFCIQRSTFEKEGSSTVGGDCINPKHGGVGIASFNMFIGCATNGTKASDKGSGTGHTTQTDYYNNTYVNGGYRQPQTGRGGDINYEQGASGQSYNNIIVDCKFGFRIVGNPIADTAHCRYGYNLSYGDADSLVDQFYPVGYITVPVATCIPAPSTFLPTGYVLGGTYTAHSLVGANNPKFVNYPLGTSANINIDYVSGFDFHLASGSPALAAGYTNFTPNVPSVIHADPIYGPTTITPPSKDLGCYPSDNSGNQH